MLSGSFPIFALSNYTTLSQTQTGATVHLGLCYLKEFLTATAQNKWIFPVFHTKK
jgi:hypothetical protein